MLSLKKCDMGYSRWLLKLHAKTLSPGAERQLLISSTQLTYAHNVCPGSFCKSYHS